MLYNRGDPHSMREMGRHLGLHPKKTYSLTVVPWTQSEWKLPCMLAQMTDSKKQRSLDAEIPFRKKNMNTCLTSDHPEPMLV